MNSIAEIKKRAATLHGGGYFTPGGSPTEAAHDVRFLLEKLDDSASKRVAGGKARWKGTKKKERSSAARAAAVARWKTKKAAGPQNNAIAQPRKP